MPAPDYPIYPKDIYTPGEDPVPGTNTTGVELNASYFDVRDYEISRIETVLGAGLVPTDANDAPEAALSTHAVVAKSGSTLYYLNLAPSGSDTVGVGSFGSGAPAGLLHVRQGNSGATPDTDADALVVEGDGATGISVLSPDASNAQLYLGSATDGLGAYVRWNHTQNRLALATSTADGEIRIRTGNEGTAMTLHDDQRVSIGTTFPGGQLKVEQPSTGAVRPALTLIQRNEEQEFIVYRGTSDSGELAYSLVGEGDVTTATRQGFVKVNVTDDGSELADQDYYMPIYTLA